MSQWQIERLAGALGARVCGADLSKPSPEDIERIKALLLEHQVLFFPEQDISMDQHVELGSCFGKVEGHPNLKNPYTEHEKVFELAATHGGVADEWHTDITFQPEPSLMSVLHMVECPPVGGDTMWSNLCQAFDELSPPMQDLCESLTALHDALPHNRPDKMTVHPVVRVHPETGRKALYVNEHFTRRIVEMNATESKMLLEYLTQWVQNPRFTVRYSWTPHTIAMWDNRCTQHFVLNDFDGERIIQRVTIMGDRPVGAREPQYEPWVRPGALSASSRQDRQLFQFLESQAESAKM